MCCKLNQSNGHNTKINCFLIVVTIKRNKKVSQVVEFIGAMLKMP